MKLSVSPSGGELTVETRISTGAKARYLCINWYSVSQTHGAGEERKKEKKTNPTIAPSTTCRDVKTQRLLKPAPLQGRTPHFF